MRRWLPIAILLVVVAGVVKLRGIARMRAKVVGLVAKQTCSCHFVDGRDVASCRADLDPDTDYVAIDVDAAAKTVVARAPGAATRTARATDGSGCTLY